LLGRFDIHVDVPPVKYTELSSKRAGKISSAIRERVVIRPPEIQPQRFENRDLREEKDSSAMLIWSRMKFCQIDERGAELLKMAMNKLGLSATAHERILKVARTIADLASAESIRAEHLGEAIQYRSLDRSFYSV
jgi:magnesium chelatase family protein